MSKIFISYRRKESLAIAGRIYERLEAHLGAGSVFMDIDSIPPGADFRAVLGTGVAKAAVVLAIIGEGWGDARDGRGRRRLDDPADFVRIEIETAFKRGIPIIPLLIGGAAMPHQSELPDSLRLLPFLNALFVDPGRDFNVHMDRLIGHLEEQVALSPAGGEPRRGGGAGYTAVELARFDAIKDSKNPLDFREFLSRFPKGHMADLVQKRLRTLEEAHWTIVKEAAEPGPLEEFLRLFPDGPHAGEAQSKVGALRPEHQRWECIKQSLDPDDFGKFLRDFPSGVHAATARQRNSELLGGLIRTFTGDSMVLCAALSPDGRIALSGGLKLCLWDTSSGQPIKELTGHEGRIHSVAFSQDGRHVLSNSGGSNDGTMTFRLWEVTTGRLIRGFAGNSSVVFSPDGQHILSTEPGRGCRLWETLSGKLVRDFGASEAALGGAFSPEGRFILSLSGGALRLWEVVTARLVRSFRLGTHYAHFVFSADGRRILSSGYGRYSLWETATGKLIREFGDGNHYGVLSPDGQYLLLRGQSYHTCDLWDAVIGRPIRKFEGGFNVFSPDGRFILSGSHDLTVKLWEVATGREIHAFPGHSGPVSSLVFSPDGQFALSGSHDHTLRLWHVGAFYPTKTKSQLKLAPETVPTAALTGQPPEPRSWWRRAFG